MKLVLTLLCPLPPSRISKPLLYAFAAIIWLFSLLLAFSMPIQTQLHSQSHISEMQIWSCHFSAQKLLLPTAYRLESKLIKMEVNALEELALTYLLASFLNVIFPNSSCCLLSLCESLHMQSSYLEFPAVTTGSVQSNKSLSSNSLQQWRGSTGSKIWKARGWQDSYLSESMACWHYQGLAVLPSFFFAFCSIYSSVWETCLYREGRKSEGTTSTKAGHAHLEQRVVPQIKYLGTYRHREYKNKAILHISV